MAGGAYIKIKDGNIYFHAPGTIEHKGAAHPFMGPTSLPKEMPRLPTSEMIISERFSLHEHLFGMRSANQPYRVMLEDGTVYEGKTNEYGETEVIESHIPQKAYIAVLNENNEIINVTEKQMLWSKDSQPPAYNEQVQTQFSVAEQYQFDTGKETRHANIETGNRNDSNQGTVGPYAFGMKFPRFEGEPPKHTGYSTIQRYYEKIIKDLRQIDWVTLFKPLADNKQKLKSKQMTFVEVSRLQEAYFNSDSFNDGSEALFRVFKNAMKFALTQPSPDNLAIPDDINIMPGLAFMSETDLKNGKSGQDGIGEGRIIGGNASIGEWQINLNRENLTLLAYDFIVDELKTPTSDREVLTALIGGSIRQGEDTKGGLGIISNLLHESRHIQQYFWCYVYMREFADNMKVSARHTDRSVKNQVPLFSRYYSGANERLKNYYQKNRSVLVKQLKANRYTFEAMEQMSMVFLQIRLAVDTKNQPGEYMKQQLKIIDALVEERFKNFIGKDNQPIACQYFTYKATQAGTQEERDYGYLIQPFENDARMQEDILRYEYAVSKEGLGKNPGEKGIPSLPPVGARYSLNYPDVLASSGSASTTGGN